nr:hypothetical protein [Streptomyces scabiei]
MLRPVAHVDAASAVTSRALVGSSQMISLGLRATARAMAMRWR